jgi:hypothetical protein
MLTLILSYPMFDAATENGLKLILEALRPHIPAKAVKPLEESIRQYGRLCGSNAVIEHLSKRTAA